MIRETYSSLDPNKSKVPADWRRWPTNAWGPLEHYHVSGLLARQ